jgi:small subunit ribosomal protein S12
MVNTPVMKSNLQLTPAYLQCMNIQSSTFSTLKNQIKPKGVPCQIGSFASGVRCLPTLNQVRRQKPRTKKVQPKPYIPKSERVLLGPQRKGVCIKVFIRKPKKPNSAQRKCALLKLSNGKTISAYIPHEKGQLQEHGVVLFEGGRVQDCPGIKYKIIRGKLDMN